MTSCRRRKTCRLLFFCRKQVLVLVWDVHGSGMKSGTVYRQNEVWLASEQSVLGS